MNRFPKTVLILIGCIISVSVVTSWPVAAESDEKKASEKPTTDQKTVLSKPTDTEKIDYNTQIKPLLSDRCYKCHGPDKETREADLRLDQFEDADELLGLGKSEQSELLRRVTSDDLDERMPPPDSKLSLSKNEIDIIRKWIKQGAKYQSHWAFAPIRDVPLPNTNRKNWARNPIDRFTLARMEKKGLSPSSEADRETLVRRLYFDLTGLPPTLEQIDAYLSDASPDAYPRLVDRLLAAPQFGENLAADWLDVARYSDSYGYQVDRERYVWPWRDWVVRAINQGMTYDQFITWQLAGDLLPGAGQHDDQILATTFNRLHSQKVEGGTVPEEFRVEYVADRNQTFGTAFLGISLMCARCHDHKYDPITQEDYYRLFAFFNNIDEAGLYSYYTRSVPTPTLFMADGATKKRIADVEHNIATQEKTLADLREKRRPDFQKWLATMPVNGELGGRVANLSFEKDGIGGNSRVPGKFGQAVKLTGDDGVGLGVGNFTRNQPFSVALWLNTPDLKDRAVIYHRSAAWTDAGSRGYQLLLEDGRLSASLIHFWPGNAIRVRMKKPLSTKTWHHVAITYDGSSRAGGLKIFVNGQPADCDIVRDHLYKNITGGGGNNITIGQRSRDRGFTGGLVDEFQVFNRRLAPIEVAQIHDRKTLSAAIARPIAQLNPSERKMLFEYYLEYVDAEYKKQLAALQSARKQRSHTVDGITEIMVMSEMAKRRTTYVLKRGVYDAPGEEVAPGVPATFPALLKSAKPDRLALARWLTGPTHPLTSRVAVNHFWQLIFGEGLVRTPEDFGSQGQAPTHPDLLDWLARDFMASGWDVKRLLKMFVLSSTYRQSSKVTKAALVADPENHFLARASRYRLSAEKIRDGALTASGLMMNQIGGKPVRPYEVSVSFKPVGHDKGEGLYRRSLYTFWKRTAPAPVMMTFDASKRDVCSVKRERTTSPLQVMVLLNSPQFVEASRVLAEEMTRKHGENMDPMIVEVFRRMTGHRPTPQQIEVLKALFAEQLQDFSQHPEKATKLLAIGHTKKAANVSAPRVAAATVLISALMNFDMSVMRR